MVTTKILVPSTTAHTINSMVRHSIRMMQTIRPDSTPPKVNKVDPAALQEAHQITIWGIDNPV